MEQPGLIPISASYVEKPVALIGILIHELVHQWTGKLRLYTALIKSLNNFPFYKVAEILGLLSAHPPPPPTHTFEFLHPRI